jgi:PAS domain S-box-containing protein
MTQPLSILILDEDESARRTIHRALLAGEIAVRVTESASFAETIQKLRSAEPPDLLLMSESLPDILSVLDQTQGLHTRIVILTAQGDEQMPLELKNAGAVDCLPMPGLTTETLWRCLRFVLPQRNDQLQAVEESLRQSVERYHALAKATGQIVWTNNPEGEMLGLQTQWAEFTGQTEAEYQGYGWSDAVHPDDAQSSIHAWQAAVAAHDTFRFEHRVRRRDGVYRLFSIRAVPILGDHGALREWVGIHTDITERRHAEDRLRFLAEASTLLASSLDYEKTLARVAQLAVPLLGDWCVVDLVEQDGTIKHAFIAHSDPARTAVAQGWQKRHPLDPATPHGAAHVIRTGRTEIVEDVLGTLFAANTAVSEELRLARMLGMRSYLCVPLKTQGRTFGALTLIAAESGRRYGPADVELAEDLARRAALAVDNARLYAHEHRVAQMLQAAFLPDIPDRLGSLDIAKLYRPGLEEAQVGGDLYDAFVLSDGRIALVMADVSGKGLEAAVQTATVKYSLRAFAAEAASPALVLRRLNHTLRSEISGLAEHFVTLFYAVFDPYTGRLIYSSAGHEAQIIKRLDGSVTLLHSNGPILGILEHRFTQDVDFLHYGDSLVLFTDGMTEARASGTRELIGLERVADAVSKLNCSYGAGALTSSLEKLALDWTAGRPQDDLALMVARRVLLDASEESEEIFTPDDTGLNRTAQDAEEILFHFAFPASADCAAEVRQAVAHWMDLLGYERIAVEDFQTAVTEAVTNAVRHGSPNGSADTIRVFGFRGPAEIFIVEIADSGPGLSQSLADIVMPNPEATSGRGLPLMQIFADELLLLPALSGLHLRLVKIRRINSNR